jgi:hypothetical protein
VEFRGFERLEVMNQEESIYTWWLKDNWSLTLIIWKMSFIPTLEFHCLVVHHI